MNLEPAEGFHNAFLQMTPDMLPTGETPALLPSFSPGVLLLLFSIKLRRSVNNRYNLLKFCAMEDGRRHCGFTRAFPGGPCWKLCLDF